MAMYVYFDKNGVLQEIVQDKSVRVGDYKANRIYMYFDTSATISDVWFIMQSPDGVLSTEVSIKDNQIDLSIPYQKNRDLHFFQDYQTYHFYYYDLDSVEVQYSGLAYATVRANVNNALYAQGLITFNVESNVIKLDNGITQSQYDYLLVTYSKTKELTEELQAKVNKLEANLNAEIERATNEETTLNTKISNEITRAQQVESSINQALNAHIDNKENPHSVTKEQIGLGNVDNTSDLDKPMSTATKDYIDTKVSGVMVYRGSVQKFSDLPTDAQNGDVYNVVEAYLAYPPNTNYAWNGSSWDPLGGSLADVYAKLNEKVDLSTMQLINGQKTFVEPLNMQKGSHRVTINYGNIKYNDLIFTFPKVTGGLVVEDQVFLKPSTSVEFLLVGFEPTGSGTQVSVKLGSNLSYDSTTKTLNAEGGGSELPGYIQFPTGDIESASYTTGVYEYLAVFEIFDTLDGTKLKEGEMTFMLPIKAGNYLAVDLDSDNKTLKVALDDTKIDKTPTKDSTNLITSGGAFKNDPLFFKTDNYLSTLSNTEKEEFNLLIEKSFTENRPIIISSPESYFFQLQSIASRIYFIGTIDDISQYEMITFYKNKNKKWEFEYDITLNYSREFLWTFSENTNYSIKANIGSISTDLVLKENELNNEQKMSYIYSLFNTNAITSLSLDFDNKWHKILEITFENQTDYTFYYLENGVIKSVIIDVSIIR